MKLLTDEELKQALDKHIFHLISEAADELGLECYVVNGQKNREDHSWNIVRVDGIPYHVDLFAPQEEGFLKSDESFWGPYRWTTSAYPQCERDYFETDEPETPELQDEPDLTADVLHFHVQFGAGGGALEEFFDEAVVDVRRELFFVFELVLQAGPEVHGDGAQLDFDLHVALFVL